MRSESNQFKWVKVSHNRPEFKNRIAILVKDHLRIIDRRFVIHVVRHPLSLNEVRRVISLRYLIELLLCQLLCLLLIEPNSNVWDKNDL